MKEITTITVVTVIIPGCLSPGDLRRAGELDAQPKEHPEGTTMRVGSARLSRQLISATCEDEVIDRHQSACIRLRIEECGLGGGVLPATIGLRENVSWSDWSRLSQFLGTETVIRPGVRLERYAG